MAHEVGGEYRRWHVEACLLEMGIVN